MDKFLDYLSFLSVVFSTTIFSYATYWMVRNLIHFDYIGSDGMGGIVVLFLVNNLIFFFKIWKNRENWHNFLR